MYQISKSSRNTERLKGGHGTPWKHRMNHRATGQQISASLQVKVKNEPKGDSETTRTIVSDSTGVMEEVWQK